MDREFVGSELRLARVFHGFALEDLAISAGKTRQYLHKLETGAASPTPELAALLANAVKVQPEFFYLGARQTLSENDFHFRKLLTTRLGVKQVTMARGELVGRVVKHLDSLLKLPLVRIPELSLPISHEDVERAAERCRSEWQLGFGPIANMTRLAESVGVVVTSFTGLSKDIDALSIALNRPVVVRNDAKESVCRQRFDVGHELGHFVMHRGVVTGDRVTESQANRFASALLVPRAMMIKLFPRPRINRLDWTGISEFKLTWKVSKSAIFYRARQLDLISEEQYKTGVITLRRHGEATREREDGELPDERPEMLARSFSVLAEKRKVFAEDVAEALQISTEMLCNVLGFRPPSRPFPLRLVQAA